MPKTTAKRIALSNIDIIDVWEKSPNRKDKIKPLAAEITSNLMPLISPPIHYIL